MLTPVAADGIRQSHSELAGRLFGARGAASLFGPSPRHRLIARLRADALDHDLAAGADPAECPQLAARAARLTSRSARRRMAEALERVVVASSLPRRLTTVRPARPAISANRGRLLELASMLRDDRPVYVRGLAELMLVLRDGTGPLYVDRHGEALTRQITVVSSALRG